MTATFALILINAAVSLATLFALPKLLEHLMLIPYRVVREKTWYELITSGFVHAGLGHLFLNMFTLFFFGPVIERVIGPTQFLVLYFTGLIVSALPSLIKYKDNPGYATLGASGAVESVLFAFIVIFPFEKIYIMLIPIGIPAILFGVLFVAYSIYASKQEGKINHEAHIAGALWGILYILLFVPNSLEHILTVFGIL